MKWGWGGVKAGERRCERFFKMRHQLLPAVKEPSQHPGPQCLGGLSTGPLTQLHRHSPSLSSPH